MKKNLNIACGGTYIRSSDWDNIDYTSNGPDVRRVNILAGIDAPDNAFDVLYCSHFIEHVPVDLVDKFLRECRRIMSRNATFRIVVPDLRFLVSEYLSQQQQGELERSEFAPVCLLDQCVRTRGGGKLADYSRQFAAGELPQLRDYAAYVLGAEALHPASSETVDRRTLMNKIHRVVGTPSLLAQRLERYYIKGLTALLPHAFRTQNISFTSIGGKHQWMYDFSSIERALTKAGFTKVRQASFDSTFLTQGFFSALDELDGQPRKGHHQLFVEAQV